MDSCANCSKKYCCEKIGLFGHCSNHENDNSILYKKYTSIGKQVTIDNFIVVV